MTSFNCNWQLLPAIVAAARVFVRAEIFQRLAENSIPPLECGQLLRSLAQVREKAGDAGESGAGARMLAMT